MLWLVVACGLLWVALTVEWFGCWYSGVLVYGCSALLCFWFAYLLFSLCLGWSLVARVDLWFACICVCCRYLLFCGFCGFDLVISLLYI